jgi:hypothetical protein
MGDEDLWNLWEALQRLPDKSAVTIHMPNQTFLFDVSELGPVIAEAWKLRNRYPDPDWVWVAGEAAAQETQGNG